MFNVLELDFINYRSSREKETKDLFGILRVSWIVMIFLHIKGTDIVIKFLDNELYNNHSSC